MGRRPHPCRGIVPFFWDDDGSHFRLPNIPTSGTLSPQSSSLSPDLLFPLPHSHFRLPVLPIFPPSIFSDFQPFPLPPSIFSVPAYPLKRSAPQVKRSSSEALLKDRRSTHYKPHLLSFPLPHSHFKTFPLPTSAFRLLTILLFRLPTSVLSHPQAKRS
jgi:hypothetical protein